MNISKKTRRLAITAVLTAITFLLGLTPIGYIPLPTMKITILCIPVLIGVLMEGLGVGLFLGGVFGLTSLIQIFMGDPLGLILIDMSFIRTLALVFIPRFLVPVTAHYTFQLIRSIRKGVVEKVGYAIAAFVGSITNTAFFLGMLYVLFIPEMDVIAQAFGVPVNGVLAVLGSIVITNGVPEAIAAVVLVTAICVALSSVKKVYPKTIEE